MHVLWVVDAFVLQILPQNVGDEREQEVVDLGSCDELEAIEGDRTERLRPQDTSHTGPARCLVHDHFLL